MMSKFGYLDSLVLGKIKEFAGYMMNIEKEITFICSLTEKNMVRK